MIINGPTTQNVKPIGIDPIPKGQLPVASGRWNFGLTKFPGTTALGLRTQAVVDALTPVTPEGIASLATALAQQHSELPG